MSEPAGSGVARLEERLLAEPTRRPSAGWLAALREGKVGDVGQFASARHVALLDRPEAGVRAIEVRVAGGIDTLVLADRGLDLGPAAHAGIPLQWQSTTGIVHPAYYRVEDWLRSFHGGLLVTAGLGNVGQGGQDGDELHGLHGRMSNTPAHEVTATTVVSDDCVYVEVAGRVRETVVYGPCLELARRLRFYVGSPFIDLLDVVTNRGFQAAPLMVLYHFNVGYPIVDETARLFGTARQTVAFNDSARAELDRHDLFEAPESGRPAQVFEHRLRDPHAERAVIGVLNEQFRPAGGIGLAVHYRPAELPRLFQWRMLAPGMYLTGLEPANCGLRGRLTELADGTVDILAPGESRSFHLRIGVALGQDRDVTG